MNSEAYQGCQRFSLPQTPRLRRETASHCLAVAVSGSPRSFLLRRKNADLDTPVECLVVRRARIGWDIPTFSFDTELVGIKFEFLNQRSLDGFRARQTEISHGLYENLPLHARIAMTFDENHGASELPGKPCHLLQSSVHIGIVELAWDGLLDIIPRRLVRVGRVWIEVDTNRLSQNGRFGRRFAETGRCK